MLTLLSPELLGAVLAFLAPWDSPAAPLEIDMRGSRRQIDPIVAWLRAMASLLCVSRKVRAATLNYIGAVPRDLRFVFDVPHHTELVRYAMLPRFSVDFLTFCVLDRWAHCDDCPTAIPGTLVHATLQLFGNALPALAGDAGVVLDDAWGLRAALYALEDPSCWRRFAAKYVDDDDAAVRFARCTVRVSLHDVFRVVFVRLDVSLEDIPPHKYSVWIRVRGGHIEEVDDLVAKHGSRSVVIVPCESHVPRRTSLETFVLASIGRIVRPYAVARCPRCMDQPSAAFELYDVPSTAPSFCLLCRSMKPLHVSPPWPGGTHDLAWVQSARTSGCAGLSPAHVIDVRVLGRAS